MNILNPKTALFVLAFLPQFVDPRRPVAPQILTLGLLFAAMGVVSDSGWALAAGSAARWLRASPRAARARRYVSGGAYIGLGSPRRSWGREVVAAAIRAGTSPAPTGVARIRRGGPCGRPTVRGARRKLVFVNPAPAPGRVWLARSIAIAADLVQIVAFPFFLPGAASPWSDALDLAVAAAMTVLIGWHWAFLPSFVAEVVPGLDLVPTWTAAVVLRDARTGAEGPRGDAAGSDRHRSRALLAGGDSRAPPAGGAGRSLLAGRLRPGKS